MLQYIFHSVLVVWLYNFLLDIPSTLHVFHEVFFPSNLTSIKTFDDDVFGLVKYIKNNYTSCTKCQFKLNPEHTVPVLDDDGFVIVDSHAINTYLVAKYGKDDSLYPKDIKKRAIVDNRLHYDSSTLFVRGLTIYKGFLFEGEKEIAPKLLIALEEAYSITEKFLENSNFIAGDHLTIADFSFITSITGWNMFFNLKEEKYPKIVAWMKRMQALPYYNEANQVGQDHFYKIVKDKLPK
ncbi:glutathione S-transferase 1-like isoform X1 [Diabrotica virgifera virgifera]|uniref:Glutathione S-transferase 1-like n=1 Tax=Diabrotica virgifera virgifera TaxID=50390 RepID=A0ABM5KTS4_DIAVI|nr:glutathione S-transferase 1-like isoform X1 [Diabrotica virgifera virgifera]